jgi:hypothetical protein
VKKIVSLFTNVLLLVVLFATGFQSIHIFSHQHHEEKHCCETHHSEIPTKKTCLTLAENDNCPICDFTFVAFVLPNHTCFLLFIPFIEVPFYAEVYQNCGVQSVSNPFLRGPPIWV